MNKHDISARFLIVCDAYVEQLRKLVKTTIRVDEEALKELHKIKGRLEAKSGKYTSLGETLEELIRFYKLRK